MRTFMLEYLQSFKTMLKTLYKWAVRYPIALIILIAICIIAVFYRKINIGPWVEYLFDLKKERHPTELANTIDPDRTLPMGVPDDIGYAQQKVQPIIISKSPFRDKETIKIQTKEGVKELTLPQGVTDTDVHRVIEVKPEVYIVSTKNHSNKSAKQILSELPKP